MKKHYPIVCQDAGVVITDVLPMPLEIEVVDILPLSLAVLVFLVLKFY
jgi:hypothetical protein